MNAMQDLRQMTGRSNCSTSIEDVKEALFNLRFQKASGQLEDANALKPGQAGYCAPADHLRERQLAAERLQQRRATMPNKRRRL